jgi:hypothetical protein
LSRPQPQPNTQNTGVVRISQPRIPSFSVGSGTVHPRSAKGQFASRYQARNNGTTAGIPSSRFTPRGTYSFQTRSFSMINYGPRAS